MNKITGLSQNMEVLQNLHRIFTTRESRVEGYTIRFLSKFMATTNQSIFSIYGRQII